MQPKISVRKQRFKQCPFCTLLYQYCLHHRKKLQGLVWENSVAYLVAQSNGLLNTLEEDQKKFFLRLKQKDAPY
jgi:hypothetical protein